MKKQGLSEVQVTDKDGRDTVAGHRVFYRKLPQFGATVKLHKQNQLRWMSKSHDTTLTQLGQWLTRAMKAMMEHSEEIWRDTFMAAGVATTGSWVINNSSQVRHRMQRMDCPPKFSSNLFALPNDPVWRAATEQQTYDFSSMYTQLRLKEMRKQMNGYGEMVFEWAKETVKPRGVAKVLLVHKNGIPKWLPEKNEQGKKNYGDTATKKVVTVARFNKWVKYLVKNLYVEVGDELMKQKVGIPMGVSCAPYLANLMLFMYEYDFIKSFIAQHDPLNNPSSRSTLWKLSCCTRYIDDLWNP